MTLVSWLKLVHLVADIEAVQSPTLYEMDGNGHCLRGFLSIAYRVGGAMSHYSAKKPIQTGNTCISAKRKVRPKSTECIPHLVAK